MTRPDGINLSTHTASLAVINGRPSANTTVKTLLLEAHSVCSPPLPAKAAMPLHAAMHQALFTALITPPY